MRYTIWLLCKVLLLMFGPCLIIIGSIIGFKFGFWLFRKELEQLDKHMPASGNAPEKLTRSERYAEFDWRSRLPEYQHLYQRGGAN